MKQLNNKKDNNKKAGKTLKRLLKYVTSTYKLQFVIVLISIVISSLVGVAGIQFLKILIDDYITPLIGNVNPDYSSLLTAVIVMGVIYVV